MASGNTAQGVAIVTGAAGGMGSATAKALFDAGWTELVICDLDAGKLDGVAAPLRAAGAKVDIVAGNVADPAFPGNVVASLRGRPISAIVHTWPAFLRAWPTRSPFSK
jgi:NAD(P)-dependent dehydrogenase (short-subunit alcohol dehydrogenase family)